MNIIIINGPNLNMLEYRNSNHYGELSYKQLKNKIKIEFPQCKIKIMQYNSEEKIIKFLHKIKKNENKYGALILNLAAYTHTSIAIADALEMIKIKKVEVHLSKVKNREDFRKINYIENLVDASFCGKQHNSYIDAINWVIERKKNE